VETTLLLSFVKEVSCAAVQLGASRLGHTTYSALLIDVRGMCEFTSNLYTVYLIQNSRPSSFSSHFLVPSISWCLGLHVDVLGSSMNLFFYELHKYADTQHAHTLTPYKHTYVNPTLMSIPERLFRHIMSLLEVSITPIFSLPKSKSTLHFDSGTLRLMMWL
jgi:hypothetical protein